MRHYAGSALMLAITTVTAIGFYTITLKVSSERAAVTKLQRQLVADGRSIRDLQAELRTRARLPQLERWNENVLMMSAPAADQYLRSPVQLASFGVAPEAPAAAPALRFAITPAGEAAPAVAAPSVVQVNYKPDRDADAAAAAAIMAATMSEGRLGSEAKKARAATAPAATSVSSSVASLAKTSPATKPASATPAPAASRAADSAGTPATARSQPVRSSSAGTQPARSGAASSPAGRSQIVQAAFTAPSASPEPQRPAQASATPPAALKPPRNLLPEGGQ